MGNSYWTYIAVALLLALCAAFSGAQTAFESVNLRKLKKTAGDTGKARLKAAAYIAENYEEKARPAILFGGLLTGTAAAALLTAAFTGLWGLKGAALAAALLAILMPILCELTPKILATGHADGFAENAALLVRAFVWLTRPLVFVFLKLTAGISRLWASPSSYGPAVTEDELVSMIETSEDEGVIDEDRSDLLQSAVAFSEVCAQEIITHRVDMVAIDVDDDMDEIIETAAASPYSRIPVYEDSIDNIIGILFLNHFYKKLAETKDFSIRDQLMEVCFIHKSMKLPAVLAELKRRRTHMAVVTDEYGGTMGVLTMEDVLEQLVGEIWDETDEVEPEFSEVEPNRYEVMGDMSIYDFLDEVGLDSDDFEGDYTTVGGWAIDMLGGYPKAGDSFCYENLTVTVAETDELRVLKLSVTAHGGKEDA